MRPSGGVADALRRLTLIPGAASHAKGSCLIRMGHGGVAERGERRRERLEHDRI